MKQLPQEFKDFDKAFNSLARVQGHYRVFEDFLDLMINSLSLNHSFERESIQKRYALEERYIFTNLIHEVIRILDKKIVDDLSWFDFFGTFYELAALSKQKGFAQFFTPPSICDFMTQITCPTSNETFSDPCCGSGRFSLAANKLSFGMFHTLTDLDYTCAKMSALNLMLHGIKGIVICDDALWPSNSFKGAFIINDTDKLNCPNIYFEKNVNKAYNYVRFKIDPLGYIRKSLGIDKKIVSKKQSSNTVDDFKDIPILVNHSTGQTSLF